VVDADRVLLDHALLVKRIDLLLFEAFVVLLVAVGEFQTHGDLLVFEVVDKVGYQRPHLLFLVQHRHHEVGELRGVLRDRLRSLVHDRLEEFSDARLAEGRLQARHRVQRDPKRPDVAPLIVALLLYDLGRQAQWSADDLLCLDVSVVVQDSRFGHVSQFDGLKVVS